MRRKGVQLSFPSQCYSSPGFLSWAASAASWKRCRSIVGILGDMVLIVVDQRHQAVPQCCIQWGEEEENKGHKILACFKLARLSLQVSCILRLSLQVSSNLEKQDYLLVQTLCCLLGNTLKLSSEVGEGDGLSLVRPLLPAVTVAWPSAV